MTDQAAQIFQAIFDKVQGGRSVRDAFDAVMGDGAYDKLAGDVWETLRARAA